MTEHKHTPGPLTVKITDKWPFRIETFDENGNVVFSRDLPAHSSKDKTPNEAVNCLNFPHDQREQWSQENHKALADEVLRAAAPELLKALIDLAEHWSKVCEAVPPMNNDQAYIKAQELIARLGGVDR